MTSTSAETAPEPERSPAGMFAAAMALLLPIAFSPNVNAFFWSPRFALLGLITAVGFPRLVLLARMPQTGKAARAAFVFVAIAICSTLLSSNVAMSTWGLYGWGNGLLFVSAIVSAWALGATIPDRGRLDVANMLVVGALVNAVIAMSQTVVDLSAYHLSLFEGTRAPALLGNPVHLGALSVAAMALLVFRATLSLKVVLPSAVLLAAGLQLSGSRFALLVGLLVLVVAAIRAPARTATIGAAVLLGALLGGAVAAAGDQQSSTSRAQVAGVVGGAARVENWTSAARAVAERPALGAGPGQYRLATSSHRSERLAVLEGADRLYYDAHNTVVEYAVTTGLLGVAAYGAWLWFALRRSGGYFLAFAAAMFALHLVQPHSLATTPLLFLALGAASTAVSLDPLPPRFRIASGMSTAVATVAGIALLVGDFRLDQARLDFNLRDARAAERLLPPWAESAEITSRLWLFQSIVQDDDPVALERAVQWRLEAAHRDDAPTWWFELGELELVSTAPARAERHFLRAIELDPQTLRARAGLAELYLRQERFTEADAVLGAARVLARTPSQREILEDIGERLQKSRARATG